MSGRAKEKAMDDIRDWPGIYLIKEMARVNETFF